LMRLWTAFEARDASQSRYLLGICPCVLRQTTEDAVRIN
jgi:hypothetical protein